MQNQINIDEIRINFDESGLWVLNIAIAIIMFGAAVFTIVHAELDACAWVRSYKCVGVWVLLGWECSRALATLCCLRRLNSRQNKL